MADKLGSLSAWLREAADEIDKAHAALDNAGAPRLSPEGVECTLASRIARFDFDTDDEMGALIEALHLIVELEASDGVQKARLIARAALADEVLPRQTELELYRDAISRLVDLLDALVDPAYRGTLEPLVRAVLSLEDAQMQILVELERETGRPLEVQLREDLNKIDKRHFVL